MPKLELLLDTNLGGKPRIGDSLLFASKNAVFNSNLSQSDLYKNSLKKFMIGKDVRVKLNHIINLINTKGYNVEVIQKSSKGQDFRNFIRLEQKSTNKSNISNVAFIIRVGDIAESLVPVNTVILTVSFEREFKTVNGALHPHFTEYLSGVQLTKLPEKRYGHRDAISIDDLGIRTEFDTKETQLKVRNFSAVAGLKKAFDMYGSNSKIQLKEQSHFIQKFNDFLKAKEENKLIPYMISDDETVKISEEKDYTFYTIHRDIKVIEPKDRFYIGSNKDYSSKVGVVISKVEEMDYKELLQEQIGDENNLKERSTDAIETNSKSILEEAGISLKLEKKEEKAAADAEVASDDLNAAKSDVALSSVKLSEAKSKQSELDSIEAKISKNLDGLKLKLSNVETKMSKIKKESNKLELKVDKLTKEDIKNKKPKKSKEIKGKESKAKGKTPKKVKTNEAEIKKIKETISKNDDLYKLKLEAKKEIEENLLVVSKELASANQAANGCRKIVSNVKDLFNIKSDEANVLADIFKEKRNTHKEIQDLIKDSDKRKEYLLSDSESHRNEIVKVEKRIELLNETGKNFEEEELRLVKLKVSVVSNKREKSLQSSIDIEASTFKDIAFMNEKDSYFSDYDAGLNMKFKRFLHTIRAYESGSYKSPYAALSLEKPDVSIEVDGDIKSPSISLNSLQQQALNATANSHFASFLQGPPGTGKTQVIASSIENEIANGGNVLISSSTNAAINNAMERMNRSKTNPNIFFLRHSNNVEKIKEAKDFTSQMLYPNFINRLDGFVGLNSSNEEIDLTIAEEAIGKVFAKKYVPSTYFKEYISQIKTFDEIKYFVDRFEVIEDEDVALAKSEIKEILVHNRRSSMKAKAERLDDFVAAQSARVTFEKEDTFETYVEKLRNFSQGDNSVGEFNKKLKILSEGFKSKKMDETKSKDFATFLFENSYINVIGITTTSQLAIKQTGGKRQRELFVDYPVNFAIIDEISKSVTPEILSVAKLADRFMFAGDYRQLPPASEISPKLVEEFRQYCLENVREHMMVDQTISAFGVHYKDRFLKSINDLLAVSLFTNQVNDMKRSKKESTSYTALKTQYRFSSVINELVNLTYDENEALSPGKTDSEFNKYEMGIKNLSESSVSIVDTSYISSDYAERLNKAKATKSAVVEGQEAFDHNGELFYKRAPFNSKINEYNSHVVTRIIENLKERNAKSFDAKKIGVIAMTRSQAQVINKELGQHPGTRGFAGLIKVDTVDNFQGQEKDIIILDLVRAKGKLEGGRVIYGNRNLDFYKKPERINVAVSRAQSKLIVVGAINEYLAPEVISEVHINGSTESINLFEEWKDIIDTKGENTTWENF